MSKVQTKITEHTKYQKNLDGSQGKEQSTEADTEITQALDLSDEDFNAVIITMLQEVKINIFFK